MAKKNLQEVEALPFEESLAKLENIVQKMEAGKLNLDEALGAFEDGMKLAQQCQQKLTQASGRVEKIMKDYEGNEKIVAAPEFEDGVEE